MSLDLSSSEKRLLKPVQELATLWGYRAGPHGEHEAFELATHTGKTNIMWIQALTDPIFRTLQQSNVYECDTFKKLRSFLGDHEFLSTGNQDDETMKEAARKLLLEFLDVPQASKAMCKLASYPVTHGSSSGFACVVTAARAFLLYAMDAEAEMRRVIKLLLHDRMLLEQRK